MSDDHNPTDQVQEMLLNREGDHVEVAIDDDEERLYVEVDGIGAYYTPEAALKLHTQLVDRQLYEEWPDELARDYIDYISDLIDVLQGSLEAEEVADEWDLDSITGNKNTFTSSGNGSRSETGP